MPPKKSSGRKPSSGSDPKSKRTVKKKMETVMHEYKHHELKSGSGKNVKNPKQAIAIGLSEARRSGAKIPPNPNAKKAAGKKTATKKSAAKKSPAKKKAAPKKAAAKATAKKTSAKRTARKSAGR